MARTHDPADILKQLDEQEAQALAEFQEAQKAKREKALGTVLQPLKDRRNKAAQERNELDLLIIDLDKQISRLLGRGEPKVAGKKRKRRPLADKLQVAQILYGVMKQNRGKYSSKDLTGQADGIPVRELVKIWNEANSDRRIEVEGQKVNTRYFVNK